MFLDGLFRIPLDALQPRPLEQDLGRTASLYATFDAETANRLSKRLRIVHTPRNSSWLNMAEMELSILSRQCINRRFQSSEAMSEAIDAWQKNRNEKAFGATWRFTTIDARVKLKGLYPVVDKIAVDRLIRN